MNELTRRTWLTALGAVPLAGAASALAAAEAPPSRKWIDADPREEFQKRHFPNVELITQHGKRVRLYDDLIKDKKVILNMMYVHCENVCSPITLNLARVQRMLGRRVGRDIFFYSFTLKPEEDTPAVLRRYARMHKIGPGWLFLTGKPDVLETVRRSLGFTYDDPVEDADDSNHAGMIRVGDERLMRWSACPGQANAKHIVRSIKEEFGVA